MSEQQNEVSAVPSKNWLLDPSILVKITSIKDFYPNKENTFEENINAIVRIIIIFGIIFTALTSDFLYLTEALKYLVLMAIIAFIHLQGESFLNAQNFVDKGGVDGGIGNPDRSGGVTNMTESYREKFTPEPRLARVGSSSFDERNIDLRKTAFFDKNILNLTSTTAGFPVTRMV